MLNQFSQRQIPADKINDLAKSLDINKDGMIDFNEFLEAFRLVSLSVEQVNDRAISESADRTQDID